MKKRGSKVIIRRGDIFRVSVGPADKGEDILRPVLVIQNDIGNRLASTIIVVPLIPSYRSRGELLAVPILLGPDTGLEMDHIAVFTLIRTLSRERFNNGVRIGRLGRDDVARVDRAICVSLGLSAMQQLVSRRN